MRCLWLDLQYIGIHERIKHFRLKFTESSFWYKMHFLTFKPYLNVCLFQSTSLHLPLAWISFVIYLNTQREETLSRWLHLILSEDGFWCKTWIWKEKSDVVSQWDPFKKCPIPLGFQMLIEKWYVHANNVMRMFPPLLVFEFKAYGL